MNIISLNDNQFEIIISILINSKDFNITKIDRVNGVNCCIIYFNHDDEALQLTIFNNYDIQLQVNWTNNYYPVMNINKYLDTIKQMLGDNNDLQRNRGTKRRIKS